MAQLWRANGERKVLEPASGVAFTLEELQTAVGGYIEVRQGHGGICLVMNEEGKLDGLPLNRDATIFAVTECGLTEPIVGDVVIASATEVD